MNVPAESERYRSIVESIDRLPSLPEVVMRLIHVVNSPDTSADDAAELIEKDPALTTTVLRLANSAFYGIPRTIASVSSAVVILGFNTLRSVALSATVMKMFRGDSGVSSFRRDRFWRHSIVTAMMARGIARRFIHSMMIDPESAFCAGILHDIGKLIFEQFAPVDFSSACHLSRAMKIPLYRAEEQEMGTTHAQLGHILADKWALPIDLECALVFHHSPGEADKAGELVSLVHLADYLTHRGGVGLWDNEPMPEEWDGARRLLRLEDGDVERAGADVDDCVQTSGEFFGLVDDGK